MKKKAPNTKLQTSGKHQAPSINPKRLITVQPIVLEYTLREGHSWHPCLGQAWQPRTLDSARKLVRWANRNLPQFKVRIAPVQPSQERFCVYCGCSSSHACPGGCHWIEEHPATPTGVCSKCKKRGRR